MGGYMEGVGGWGYMEGVGGEGGAGREAGNFRVYFSVPLI